MNDEMDPQAALAVAALARSAASRGVAPGWFPAVAASAWVVGMTLVGTSVLVGGAMWALGAAGAVVLAGFAGLWVMLVAWWWRRGVVPAPPRLDRRLSPRQRRAGLAADFAAIALSLAVLVITGRLGWAAIASGWAGGTAMWYRLRSRAA